MGRGRLGGRRVGAREDEVHTQDTDIVTVRVRVRVRVVCAGSCRLEGGRADARVRGQDTVRFMVVVGG